jgi:GNAT superfamily N-acetyltransferase
MEMSDMISTKNPRVRLYFAGEDDVGLIMGFIRELAEYEKLSNEMVADERTLKKSLFGDRRVAEVIIARYDDQPAGFALFFHNFSTFLGQPGIYLEDLFVKPEFRRKGVGKILLRFLAKIAVERGCGRMEWWVLDWNKTAVDFYKSFGAEAMDDWTVFRIAGPTLAKLAKLAEA